MNSDKKAIVEQLLERLQDSPFMLVVDYTGMSVPQFNEVRKRLRESNSKFHVTKNSYVKALGESKNYPKEIEKDLVGQTAIVFGESDVCAAAKAVASAAKEFQKPVIKSGVLDGKLLSAADVNALAEVGSRNNMLAMLLGVLNAPGGALARVINAKYNPDGGSEAAAAE
jgi:large subunit ribosomal protein L10